ncbi:hypothetical protein TWF481_003732 [Arthrobotrys musiformis]|uniref:Uncharacterized protein n=1 Tax=Arthrobotrys musiformis TaxID=47236 RepID=A0AAV9WHD8_9PEZI
MTSRHQPPQSSSPSPLPSTSTAAFTTSRTNNNRQPPPQHIRDQSDFSQPDPTKKPFTSSSYRSRFSNPNSSSNSSSSSSSSNIPSGYSAPKKRRSVFIEQLGSTTTDQSPSDNASIAPSPSKRNTREISRTTNTILSINPLGRKDSYMMHLPFQPLRISILLLLLVTFTTISLSASAESDLDSLLLKRVPGEAEGVVERREASIAPSFRIGPAVRNPEKDIPKLRTGLLVLVISLVFAGLMT